MILTLSRKVIMLRQMNLWFDPNFLYLTQTTVNMKNINIFTVILILYLINRKNILFCNWKVLKQNTYDKNKSKIVRNYIYLLKKLKLNYFLGFGSELGALRNGGVIKYDHDMDVIIPIWLNYEIFKCKEYISYYPHKCKIYSNIKTKVCNKTKYQYMMILREYIQKLLKRKVYYKCKFWGEYGYFSCWMMKKYGFFLDIWIMIGYEYFYQNIKICKCLFSDFLSFCTENALEYSIKSYGYRWYIPIKSGSGEKCCNVILYPNSNNSIIKHLG